MKCDPSQILFDLMNIYLYPREVIVLIHQNFSLWQSIHLCGKRSLKFFQTENLSQLCPTWVPPLTAVLLHQKRQEHCLSFLYDSNRNCNAYLLVELPEQISHAELQAKKLNTLRRVMRRVGSLSLLLVSSFRIGHDPYFLRSSLYIFIL